jgi:ABC-2 type transport system permease protein
MGETWALFRAGWLHSLSYRLNLAFSLLGLGATVVPVYFVAGALQPMVADSIRAEGGHYFGFLVIGLATLSLLATVVTGLAAAVGTHMATGTLETILATPARPGAVMLGLVSYDLSWALVKVVLLLAAGLAGGMPVRWGSIPLAGVALGLTILAYFGLGLLLAAMVLAYRTTGPLPNGILLLSALLGGVYYSTSVIPSWLQQLSIVVPLTYGLRAMRQALLLGLPARDLSSDLLTLAGAAAILLALGGASFGASLRQARRHGTLGQY